jgi:two-component system nitrogen regulation sensor histidine kinase NtrY
MDTTRLAASDSQQLGFKQLDLQISFAALFGFILMLLLITALWIGLNLATAIVGPLGAVIRVAEQVRGGNLSQRVPDNLNVEEIAQLGGSFNRMLDELARSRQQLVQANLQLDQRREFTEALLGGVSSGVIGLDTDGKITLPNASARNLLGKTDQQLIGYNLVDVLPEFAQLMAMTSKISRRFIEDQITIVRGSQRTILRARLVNEQIEGQVIGFVVTFDDVSDLLSAQRKAAWSDIARRIAHEIKNPLTPIQLASDRLRKKFKPKSAADSEKFEEYVDIISRQVGDIGRMVDEFSAFARMPQPVMKRESLYDLAAGQITLFKTKKLQMSLKVDNGKSDYVIVCDAGLLRQAFTNLLRNAQDSLLEHKVKSPKVSLLLKETEEEATLTICDNGPGFPDMDVSQLLEPYVTTRKKGTGLGLAIVSKIMDDHAGRMELGAADDGGASVKLCFNR